MADKDSVEESLGFRIGQLFEASAKGRCAIVALVIIFMIYATSKGLGFL